MSDIEEMGPVDWILVEFSGPPTGAVAPHLLDLVDRGLIRIIDVAFLAKGDDGSVAALDLGAVGAGFEEFEGASTGMLGDEDLEEAAQALEPGATAAIIVWENHFLAPIASALRRSGGQLVATGRIPVQDLLTALDLVETAQ
jgi:dihydroorotase-like cyclic amidohydrolase